VGRTFFSAAFDLDLVFRTAGYVSENCDIFKPKSNFKGGGQECPPHTIWFLLILNA
jgi:hypothetical protein